MGLDDFIWECWNTNAEGWRFRLESDLWWEIEAESKVLGTFKASTYGPMWGVEDTLSKLMDLIRKTHKEWTENGVDFSDRVHVVYGP